MKQVNQVGVDVDSEALVSMMRRGGQRLPLARFANSAGGHKKFIRWATKGARPVRVCLEATGSTAWSSRSPCTMPRTWK
jgi:hypothetical protein